MCWRRNWRLPIKSLMWSMRIIIVMNIIGSNWGQTPTPLDDTAIVKAAIQNVQTLINNVNTEAVSIPLAEIAKGNGAGYTNADELLALLKDTELALGNVVDANKGAYYTQEVAIALDYFLTNFPVDKDNNRIAYGTFAAVQADIDAAIAATK